MLYQGGGLHINLFDQFSIQKNKFDIHLMYILILILEIIISILKNVIRAMSYKCAVGVQESVQVRVQHMTILKNFLV